MEAIPRRSVAPSATVSPATRRRLPAGLRAGAGGQIAGVTYLRGLRETLIETALPYGFTVTFLASSQALISSHGTPNVGQLYLFAGGAALAYGTLRVLLHRLEPAGTHPSETSHPIRAGAIHVAAIAGGIGAAALIARIDGGVAWPLGGFACMVVYLLCNAIESWLQARTDT